MGQGGNVWEWNETALDGTNDIADEDRDLRGGSWLYNSLNLDASKCGAEYPWVVNGAFGFRVASVPEPSTGLLVLLGLGGLLLKRRK